jgi:large subunit ribosomal protein L23
MKNPFDVIKSRYITEKARMLESLCSSTSNRQISRFDQPKYVFLVDIAANKSDIARALEEIYKDQKVKVAKVNTITIHSKPKRRGRGRPGKTASYKKAVVTMGSGDSIDNL